MNEGLIQLLENAARSEGGIRFLDGRGNEQRIAYADLLRRARRFGGGLQALGVRPGDRVAIILPTSPAFFDAFFGAQVAGAVPVPLYPPVRLGRLTEYRERTVAMLRASNARLMVTDSRTRRLLGETVAAAAPALGCVAAAELAGTDPVAVDRSASDLAFIQFSSGTTSAPKPVGLGAEQVLSNCEAIHTAVLDAHPMRPERPHICVSWLPLYHDMGLIGAVLTSISQSIELVLIPPERFIARPVVWLRAMSRFRATISLAPNFAYSLCADRITDEELGELDLSSWCVAFNGAEPVTAGVLSRFVDRFAACGLPASCLTPVYGLAEATLAVTFTDVSTPFSVQRFDRDALVGDGVAIPTDDGVALVNVGKPVKGVELRIAADDGSALAARKLGRVIVRGRSIMQGYVDQPEVTARVMSQGWLDTGDLGFVHDGDLYLFGRDKDVIVINGRNHAPQTVEQALDDLPEVRRGCSAAFGVVPEEGDGEQLVVLAERAQGAEGIDPAELADRVSRHISKTTGLVPMEVVIVEPGTLPRTSSGKIRRSEARRLHLSHGLEPPAPVSALRLAGPMVRSWWAFTRHRLSRER